MEGNVNYDLLESTVGKFGIWQLWISIIIIFSKIATPFHQGSIIYIAPSQVKFTCQDPVVTDEKKLCEVDCHKYEFNKEIFEETIVSEFHLICDKKYLAPFAHTVFMIGNGLGNLVAGILADKYGRKKIFICYIIIQLLTTVALTVAPNYIYFIIFRFISGIGIGGLGIGYVLLLEIVGGKYRELISCVYLITFPLGLMILAIFAFLCRSWRPLYIIFSTVALVILLSTFFIPESPRYLMGKNKIDKCVAILERGAKRNNLPTEKIREIVEKKANEMMSRQSTAVKNKRRSTLTTLVAHKQLRIKTYICNYMFFTASLLFFGTLQFIDRLDKNIFVANFFSAMTGIPGLFISMFLNKYFPRKIILLLSCLLISIGMIFIIHFGKSKVSVAAAQISLFGLAVLVTTLTIYIAEYFPTTVRTSAVGLCFAASNFGSALSSFPPLLADYGIWLPPLFFTIMSGIGFLLLLFLPETKGTQLSETIDDVKH